MIMLKLFYTTLLNPKLSLFETGIDIFDYKDVWEMKVYLQQLPDLILVRTQLFEKLALTCGLWKNISLFYMGL